MKFLLSLSIFAFAFAQDAAAYFRVTMVDGGLNGYYTVKEKHTEHGSSLDCKDPGNVSCCWSISPAKEINGTIYNLEDIRLNVVQMIGEGELAGAYSLDGNIIVSWVAADIYNAQIDVRPIE